ncbi:MAG: asparaginase [Pseudomonadota bacterium]|nr:asparaginase [Pseudomonadota bacterium]
MQSGPRTLVVLGTGGTIAGRAESPDDHVAYRSASLPIAALVASLGVPAGLVVESEQVAQLDSKDMDFATWRRLAARIAGHLARPEVVAIVVSHGTDTLEETAYFLQRVLAPAKPVVLTAAMRPATSRLADGPQNLADAVTVATAPGAHGVVAVVAGTVHSALDLRKVHPYRLDAFGSGDAGPIGRVEQGRLRLSRSWPTTAAGLGIDLLPADESAWPRVGIVTSSAGADAKSVRALVDAGFAGLVVAATGNGTIHAAFGEPLREAIARGCHVLRSTRCLDGAVIDAAGSSADNEIPSAGALTPQQARVELIVRLLERRRGEPA